MQISAAESARPALPSAVSRTGRCRARGRTAPGLSTAKAALAIAVGLLAAFALGPGAQSADTYYRWKDERGRLVVSDRPPEDGAVDYEVISLGSTTLVRRAQPGQGALAPEPEVAPAPGADPQGDATPQETMEVVVPKNPEICAQAQTNLKTLNTSARIRIRDRETGEPRFISEEEREVQRQKARDTIRVHCD